MPPPQAEPAMKAVEALFRSGVTGHETDGRLLARFLDGDEAIGPPAFAAIVERHAAMVLGVCRRSGLDPHDADDAAQATFLVLARRARSIRDRDSLASWLFGVADRVARRAKADATRRRAHERRKAEMTATRAAASDDPAASAALDEEIARLPDRLSDPIVACYLEGLTQEQAASRLNLPLRTIQRRLAQGRERLRARLERRGIAAPGDGPRPAAPILPFGRPVEPTSAWMAETTTTAAAYAKGGLLAGTGSLAAKGLADAMIGSLTMTKLRIAALLMIAGTAGLAGLIPLARGQKPPEPAGPIPAATKPREGEPAMKLTVRDSRTKAPIAGVTVRVGEKEVIATDPEGRAEVRFRPKDAGGSSRAWIKKPGYVPTRIGWSAAVPSPVAYTLDLEPGTTLGGRVLAPDDSPIAGVKVHVSVSTSGLAGSNPDSVADPEHSAVDLSGVTVFTGPDGTWHHDEIPAAIEDIRIELEHPDFVFDSRSYTAETKPAIEALRDRSAVLRMKRGIAVRGRVTDDEGRPIAGATVRGGERYEFEVATDRDGRFRLPKAEPGALAVTVKAKGHAPDLVTVDAQPALAPLEFRLGPPNAIRGRVVDPRGKPIAGARVMSGEWRELRTLNMKAETDADGRFRLDDAPADPVVVYVDAKGFMHSPDNRFRAGDEAADIALVPTLKVAGRVVDAETGEPVPSFKILVGDGARTPPLWDRDEARTFRDGRYAMEFDWPHPQARILRVEAEGYAPATSPAYFASEGGDRTYDFKMARGSVFRPAVSGVVLKPDGSPASGVTVNLATPNQPMEVVNGIARGSRPHPTAKSAADGSFRFAPQEEAGWVVVLDDSGFAMTSEESLRESAAIRLAAWGRIEGIARSGSGVAPEATMYAQPLGLQRDPEASRAVRFSNSATSGKDGAFAFERAVPGEASVSRMVMTSRTSSTSQSATRVEVRPGETARVTVGGGGRTVAGRFEVAKGANPAIDWTPMGTYASFRMPAPPVPEPPNLTPREKAVWHEQFRRSDAGQAYAAWQKSPRFHAVIVAADGSFRVEDVRPGTYMLRAETRGPDRKGGPIGAAQAVVVVPESADGDLDKVLDVGAIEWKPTAR